MGRGRSCPVGPGAARAPCGRAAPAGGAAERAARTRPLTRAREHWLLFFSFFSRAFYWPAPTRDFLYISDRFQTTLRNGACEPRSALVRYFHDLYDVAIGRQTRSLRDGAVPRVFRPAPLSAPRVAVRARPCPHTATSDRMWRVSPSGHRIGAPSRQYVSSRARLQCLSRACSYVQPSLDGLTRLVSAPFDALPVAARRLGWSRGRMDRAGPGYPAHTSSAEGCDSSLVCLQLL